jgi:hypothetical protein
LCLSRKSTAEMCFPLTAAISAVLPGMAQ